MLLYHHAYIYFFGDRESVVWLKGGWMENHIINQSSLRWPGNTDFPATRDPWIAGQPELNESSFVEDNHDDVNVAKPRAIRFIHEYPVCHSPRRLEELKRP